MAAKTGAQRQTALRNKGRQVAVVLREQSAIKALDALTVEHGGVTAAVTFALHAAAANLVNRTSSHAITNSAACAGTMALP